jgi:hypothetical protein
MNDILFNIALYTRISVLTTIRAICTQSRDMLDSVYFWKSRANSDNKEFIVRNCSWYKYIYDYKYQHYGTLLPIIRSYFIHEYSNQAKRLIKIIDIYGKKIHFMSKMWDNSLSEEIQLAIFGIYDAELTENNVLISISHKGELYEINFAYDYYNGYRGDFIESYDEDTIYSIIYDTLIKFIVSILFYQEYTFIGTNYMNSILSNISNENLRDTLLIKNIMDSI